MIGYTRSLKHCSSPAATLVNVYFFPSTVCCWSLKHATMSSSGYEISNESSNMSLITMA